jgi:hypothetical protein
MKHIDLTEVWRPYLVARGLEDWIEKSVIEDHFKDLAKGAAIEYVVIEAEGTEAKIMFQDPQGMNIFILKQSMLSQH